MYQGARLAHNLYCQQSGSKTEFEGLRGNRFTLVHRKVKSGGRDVFITQIEYSDKFSNFIMSTLQRGIEAKQDLMLSGEIIEPANLLEAPSEENEDTLMLTFDEQKSVAVEFVADADKSDNTPALDKAAESLMQ